jgi:signal transduction histidine kinase
MGKAEMHGRCEYPAQRAESQARGFGDARKRAAGRQSAASRAGTLDITLHNIANVMTCVSVNTEVLMERMAGVLGVLDRLEARYQALCAQKGPPDERPLKASNAEEARIYTMGGLLEALRKRQSECSDSLNAITAEIGHISRLLAVRGAPHKEVETRQVVDLKKAVRTALDIQGGLLERRGIRVKTLLAAGVTITVNRNGLVHALMNLIKNAYEAVEAIGPDAPLREIEIRVFEQGGAACLEVRDTGIGLGPEDLPRVFEPGVSGKGSSGIGLYYCRTWAEKNNGTCRIMSRGRGKGCTVVLAFER